MVYECETCEALLTPGLIACPHCGQVFDDPVPDDAVADEVEPTEFVPTEVPPGEAPLEMIESGDPPVRRTPRLWSAGRRAALVALLLGLGWLGYRHESSPPARPASIAPVVSHTDLEAHPQYAANMTVFVQKLRAMGVSAEWPAFSSNDVLLITPQSQPAEAPVAWNLDMYRRLAQGVYGQFAQNRYESGFAETDTTACFVIVTSASGKVMAVDFMGSLQ